MGINFEQVVLITFALGSALAALAGMINGLYYNEINFSMGLLLGVIGFSAAVVGGLGNIYGAILGGFLFAGLQTIGAVALPFASAYKDVFAFAVVILLMAWQPTGLIAEKSASASERHERQAPERSVCRSPPRLRGGCGAVRIAVSRRSKASGSSALAARDRRRSASRSAARFGLVDRIRRLRGNERALRVAVVLACSIVGAAGSRDDALRLADDGHGAALRDRLRSG